MLSQCPPGKILNPSTKRCVNKDGKIGMILLGNIVKKEVNKTVNNSVNNVVNTLCPPGKILNPSTKRCVKKDGKIGLALLTNNVKKEVNKTVNNVVADVIKKVCPPGKILNPKTNICVNKDGKIGMALLGIAVKKEVKKAVNNGIVNAVQKVCPPGKILNPKTNICVNKDGKIGMALLGITVKKEVKKAVNNGIDKVVNNAINNGINNTVNNTVNNGVNNQLNTSINNALNFVDCKFFNNVTHYSACPYSWVLATIVSLKHSKIHNYINQKYSKLIDDSYSLLLKQNSPCPNIPNEVCKEYVKYYNDNFVSKFDIKYKTRTLLVNNDLYKIKNGIPEILLYAFIKQGITSNNKISFTSNFVFETPESKEANIIIDQIPMFEGGEGYEYFQHYIYVDDDRGSSTLLNSIKKYESWALKKGFEFSSGVLTFELIPSYDNRGYTEYNVAFIKCDNKYYVCDTNNSVCVNIRNKQKFFQYFSKYKKIVNMTLLAFRK